MTKKNPGHTFPLCKICGTEYEAYGAAGHARHMKAAHPAEWEDYKENVLLPNLQKAIGVRTAGAEKKRRKKRAYQQVAEETATESAAIADPELGADLPEPEPLSKPAAGAMPQQIFSVLTVMPPMEFGGDETIEIEEESNPGSDVKQGSTVVKPTRTNDFREAQVFAYSPKVFQFSSNLIHTAWQITVREWGWDPNMPMGVWLDTLLYIFFERVGVIMRAYEVLPQGGNGNGHESPSSTPVRPAAEGLGAAEFWTRQGAGG
jgi:hypothetical protein